MNGKVRYGKSIIKYDIVKSKRRKTSEIQVDENGVVLRIPITKNNLEIKNIMETKKQWVYKKQLEFKYKKKIEKNGIYKIYLPYLGKNYPLKAKPNQKKNYVKFQKSKFLIGLTGKRLLTRQIKKVYDEWLESRALKYLKSKTAKLSTKADLKPAKIVVKNLKGRWGSASKEGIINLNLNLMKCPKDIIDYIIIHELCHLKFKDHSRKYWSLVRKHYPNYEEKIKNLEKISKIIF